MKKGIIVLIVIIVLIITGCDNKENATLLNTQKKITLYCEPVSDSQTINALEVLKEKMWELSEGKMALEYDVSKNPINEIKNNKSDLALITSKTLTKYGSDFEMISAPFLFTSAKNATMVINSKKFKEIFGEYIKTQIGCELINAVYLSSDMLATTNSSPIDIDDLKKAPVYIYDNFGIFEKILEKNEIEIKKENEKNYYDIINLIDEMFFIFNMENNEKIDVFSENGNINLVSTPLKVDFQWLMADEKFLNTLKEDEKNILLESIAYFNAVAEENRIFEFDEMIYSYKKYQLNYINKNRIAAQFQTNIKFNDFYTEHWDMNKYMDLISII